MLIAVTSSGKSNDYYACVSPQGASQNDMSIFDLEENFCSSAIDEPGTVNKKQLPSIYASTTVDWNTSKALEWMNQYGCNLYFQSNLKKCM